MWLFWSIFAMFGSLVWYLVPRFFIGNNPFSVIFFGSIFAIIPALLLSKFFYGVWLEVPAWKQGLASVFTWISTIGLILALNAGGKLGPVAVIIEVSLVLAAIAGMIFFSEKLVMPQILGILITFIGVGLVVYFEK